MLYPAGGYKHCNTYGALWEISPDSVYTIGGAKVKVLSEKSGIIFSSAFKFNEGIFMKLVFDHMYPRSAVPGGPLNLIFPCRGKNGRVEV